MNSGTRGIFPTSTNYRGCPWYKIDITMGDQHRSFLCAFLKSAVLPLSPVACWVASPNCHPPSSASLLSPDIWTHKKDAYTTDDSKKHHHYVTYDVIASHVSANGVWHSLHITWINFVILFKMLILWRSYSCDFCLQWCKGLLWVRKSPAKYLTMFPLCCIIGWINNLITRSAPSTMYTSKRGSQWQLYMQT